MFEGFVATEIARIETARAERQATLNWRFRRMNLIRHPKPRSSQVVIAILTNVLGLFLR